MKEALYHEVSNDQFEAAAAFPGSFACGARASVTSLIGASKSMDCLNLKLKQEVDRVNPTINQPPIDARSPGQYSDSLCSR
jgi:hypothetical protein